MVFIIKGLNSELINLTYFRNVCFLNSLSAAAALSSRLLYGLSWSGKPRGGISGVHLQRYIIFFITAKKTVKVFYALTVAAVVAHYVP